MGKPGRRDNQPLFNQYIITQILSSEAVVYTARTKKINKYMELVFKFLL